jgi:hypothetical protein
MEDEAMSSTLQTPYGIFSGITTTEYYPDGKPCGIRLEEQNVIVTHAGELIPVYSDDSARRKYKSSVTFHQNGMVKAVEIEAQQDVMTPIGELPAELITFYETGEVKRVFPLDGRISGFWSEEEERALNIPLRFDFEFASFTAMISGLCFFKNGQIRSLTLFPNETIDVKLSDNETIKVRNGFSLYKSGALASIEPAAAIPKKTPIGTIFAYDCTACGINADSNSLRLDEQGRIIGLVTSSDRIFVTTKTGESVSLARKEIAGDDDECGSTMIPLTLEFDYEEQIVAITNYPGIPKRFSFDDAFFIFPDSSSGCTPADCASCTLCKNGMVM